MAELFKLMGTIAIDVTDATQKITGVIEAGEGLKEALAGIGSSADSSIGSQSGFAAASVWLGNTITELTKRAANLGKEFVLAGLKYNAAMEGYEVSFGTLLNGDTEKAKQLMADIQAFALDSPLSVSGVSAAALQLLNIGTAYEDVMPMLKMLGDLSLGDASKMDRLAIALSQTMGFGQLYGQEKQQFVNAGVPLYTLLEDYYKIVEGMNPESLDLSEMQKDGKILSEHVLGALQLATMSSEEILAKYGFSGERAVSFYNAMAAMLPTYTGQTQKATEQTEIAAGAIVKPYQDEATESVLPAFTELMAAVAEKYENDETQKKTAESIGDFVTNVIDSLTASVRGEFDLSAENAENLTPFGKFIAGVYDWADFWNETEKNYAETHTSAPDYSYDPNVQGIQTILDFFSIWSKPEEEKEDGKDGVGGSLKQLNENMHDRSMLFASTNGVPDRGRGFESPTASIEDANANFSTLAATLAGLQGLLSSLPAQIESAASNGVATGVSGITVTGTITTGNVVLNTGALVGQLTPKLNLSLGTASKYAHRTV